MKPYILVIRQLGGIGDVLAMTPVFRGLREKYPAHEIHYVTAEVYLASALYDIASHIPTEFVDKVVIIEPYDATTQKTKEVWDRHFANAPNIEDDVIFKRADIVVDLNTACVDYEWPALHSKEGITKPRYEVWCDHAGVVPSSYKPLYQITKTEREAAKKEAVSRRWREDCKPVIGVGVTSVDDKRALGQGRLKDVCHYIEKLGGTVVTIDSTFRYVGDDGQPLFQYIVGKRLRELMPLIELMDCVVSADSGILHMAGTVGTPVVGIFGPTDPEMRMRQYIGSAVNPARLVSCFPCWYLYPCQKKEKPNEQRKCLKSVDPAIIAEEAIRWATGMI